MADYVTAGGSLPRTLDVQISVSNAQIATPLNLSVPCIVTETNIGLLMDANRIRFYDWGDLDAVANDYGTTSEPYYAALAFMSQNPAPAQMAVAQVWLTPQPAMLVAPAMTAAQIAALNLISAGNLLITIATSLATSSIAGSCPGTVKNIYGSTIGTFDLGETITQGTTGATAVVQVLPTGSAPMVVNTVTNGSTPPDAVHSWTGNTSHSTLVPSTAPAPVLFENGETVTQATSLATALVVGGVSPAGPMIVTNVSGSPDNSHNWIGGTSYASFTPTAVPVATGLYTVMNIAYTMNGLDFSAATTLSLIAAVIQAAFTDLEIPATCSIITFAGGIQRLVIQSTLTGSNATISYPSSTGSGTFAGTALGLTAATGCDLLNGYTPTDIASELDNVQNAANLSNQFIYGWVLGQGLRVPAIQQAAASWALAQQYAMMPLVSNDPGCLNPSYDSDIGSLLLGTANKRVCPIYHNNIQQYPDMSILAYMLSVNYKLTNSTVVAKFKTLPGISFVPLTVTQFNALTAKGYNVYTSMGQGVLTYREGNTDASQWWMDTVINIDNFVNDLSTNVYNVFLRNGKVPFTGGGQLLLVDACVDTGKAYTYNGNDGTTGNGTFADRLVQDSTQKSGYSVTPAVVVTPQPVWMATSSQRVARIGTPIAMVVQDSGAMQSIAINVTLVE